MDISSMKCVSYCIRINTMICKFPTCIYLYKREVQKTKVNCIMIFFILLFFIILRLMGKLLTLTVLIEIHCNTKNIQGTLYKCSWKKVGQCSPYDLQHPGNPQMSILHHICIGPYGKFFSDSIPVKNIASGQCDQMLYGSKEISVG